MKAKYILFLFAALFTLASCEPEDNLVAQPFVAAFEKQSYKFTDIGPQQEFKVMFSEKAQFAGTVRVRIAGTLAVYGTDFSTAPEADSDFIIALPFQAGDQQVSFIYNNLMLPYEEDDNDKAVLFEIAGIDYAGYASIQGYREMQLGFTASLGATLMPQTGGPNQGNQVFVDLSEETETMSRRDVWDLGFYAGDDFRVILNGSLYMAARNLNVTDIDAVTQASVSGFQNQVAVGTFDPANENYIDAPSGVLTQTAIAGISANIEENKVYLLNMGYAVGNTTPPVGSVAITGDARGWKKIRILREGEGYKLQYAAVNSTTHQEVTISKNAAYNFTFFSFNTNNTVMVEPEKDKWDLCFNVFTNTIDGAGSYGYSDFVLNNLKAGVKAYRINVTQQLTYQNFTKAQVNDALFEEDQRVIGADWRDVFTGTAYSNRFYVLKDLDGNYYKIKMLGFLSETGQRGYPKFEYKLLP